jgi:hypothetical protein
VLAISAYTEVIRFVSLQVYFFLFLFFLTQMKETFIAEGPEYSQPRRSQPGDATRAEQDWATRQDATETTKGQRPPPTQSVYFLFRLDRKIVNFLSFGSIPWASETY